MINKFNKKLKLNNLLVLEVGVVKINTYKNLPSHGFQTKVRQNSNYNNNKEKN